MSTGFDFLPSASVCVCVRVCVRASVCVGVRVCSLFCMALADYELAIMLMSLATKQKSAPSAGPQHHKRVIVMYITNTYERHGTAWHGVCVYRIHAYVYVCAYLYACMQASEYIKRNFVFISICQRVATPACSA